MCNCTCAEDDAVAGSDHEFAAIVFVVLTLLACCVFLAWPALSSVCCPPHTQSDEEIDLALSLLQMNDSRGQPAVELHEMAPSSDKGDSTDDEDTENIVPARNKAGLQTRHKTMAVDARV